MQNITHFIPDYDPDDNHAPDSASLLWGCYNEWLEASRMLKDYPSDDVAEEVTALDLQLQHEIYKIRRTAIDRVRIRANWNGEVLDAKTTFERAIRDALKFEEDCKSIKRGSMPRRSIVNHGEPGMDAKYDRMIDDSLE